jgi:hypothetical protein
VNKAVEIKQLKGTVHRDFLPPILSLIDSSQVTSSVFKDFLNLASNSVRYSAVIYSGELIFPVLFTTESCDSPHHFDGESPFVSIICITFLLLFNTESQYSLY